MLPVARAASSPVLARFASCPSSPACHLSARALVKRENRRERGRVTFSPLALPGRRTTRGPKREGASLRLPVSAEKKLRPPVFPNLSSSDLYALPTDCS